MTDKSFADAYSGLADTYLLSSFRGYEDPVQMLWQAKKNIDIATGLDAYLGETQASLGYWYFQNFDWHAAEITYQRAISLNPNQTNVYLWLGILLQAKGEHKEALKIYDKGAEINPMWEFLQKNKINSLFNLNDLDGAVALQNKLIEKAAHNPLLQKKRITELSRLYWSFNDKEAAIAQAVKVGSEELLLFYRDGDHSLLHKRVDDYYNQQNSSVYTSQLWKGLDYAYAGAREKALECFNNAIALKEAGISLLLIRDYEFLNIKYLNMALITRKVKQLINF